MSALRQPYLSLPSWMVEFVPPPATTPAPQTQVLGATAAPAPGIRRRNAARTDPSKRTAAVSGTRVQSGAKNRRSASNGAALVRRATRAHVSQVVSRFNPDAPAGNRDCGPASAVVALRILGIRVPGAGKGASAQDLIDRMRRLGTGTIERTKATSNLELERALASAGTNVETTSDANEILAAIRAGNPVVMHGNPEHAGAFGTRLTDRQALDYDGDHWITVTGFDEQSGKFIVNDPLVRVGAIKVTPAELDAYRDGSLGLIVSRR